MYDSVEEGMKQTIAYFTSTLLSLRTTRQFKIYIHPVPPVLNETRTIVTVFNRLYKQAIVDLQG
jgi:hypothetical protein